MFVRGTPKGSSGFIFLSHGRRRVDRSCHTEPTVSRAGPSDDGEEGDDGPCYFPEDEAYGISYYRTPYDIHKHHGNMSPSALQESVMAKGMVEAPGATRH